MVDAVLHGFGFVAQVDFFGVGLAAGSHHPIVQAD